MDDFNLDMEEIDLDVLEQFDESLSTEAVTEYPHFSVDKMVYDNIRDNLISGDVPLVEKSSGELLMRISSEVDQITRLLYIFPSLSWVTSESDSISCANIDFLMGLVKITAERGLFEYD